MGTGAITAYADVAQLVLYAFWAFFLALIYYLVRENHREGYPMDTGRENGPQVTGWPVPTPKVYKLAHGGELLVPRAASPVSNLKAMPMYGSNSAPLVPTGDPLVSCMGPAAWAHRTDQVDLAHDDRPKIQPLRIATEYGVDPSDPDPRGMTVFGADGVAAGTVKDIWVDRSEPIFRYLEVETPTATGPRSVVVPILFCKVSREDVKVDAILASQFANAPQPKAPDQLTFLEEDQISAYYAGGLLYAEPSRQEPLV